MTAAFWPLTLALLAGAWAGIWFDLRFSVLCLMLLAILLWR